MQHFTYVIGANIELFVAYKMAYNDMASSNRQPEIISVSLSDGRDIETDDIFIKSNTGEIEHLDSLLTVEANYHHRQSKLS